MRRIAVIDTIKVDAPDLERILAECARDVVDRVFDRKHALRPAEPAKRGVRRRVRLAAVRVDVHVFQEIRVVAVEHRAVVDGPGQVGRDAAARCEHEVHAEDTAVLVEADVVVDDEVVALAGHDHVVVAVEAQLGWAPCRLRYQRCRRRHQVCLGLLAAETAADPPHLHHD